MPVFALQSLKIKGMNINEYAQIAADQRPEIRNKKCYINIYR